MRRATWAMLILLAVAVAVPATGDARAASAGDGGGVTAASGPATCRRAHGGRIAAHQQRIAAVRGEMGANERALKATREPAEIATRLATRADLRRRLARLEADRSAVERRSLALMKICARATASIEPSRPPKRIVRHCRHVSAGSRLACR